MQPVIEDRPSPLSLASSDANGEVSPRLRVLMVADVDPVHVIGGAERMLNEHSVRLAARGHRVVVLTRRENPEYPPEEVHRGVRVVRHPVVDGGTIAFTRSVVREGKRALVRLLREEPFDLINVHQPLAGASILGTAQQHGVPALYTYLSPWGDEYRVRANKELAGQAGQGSLPRKAWVEVNTFARQWTESRVLAASRGVMALSEFTTTQLSGIHGIPPSRPVVIPGGVDTERFQPPRDRAALRKELGLPDGFLMVTVRNLVQRMGLDALVTAMAEVVKLHPNCHLAIGGKGELREALERQARELGLSGNIRFLGFVSDDHLPKLYGAADLFVLPTRTLEGFGLVTVEALACGTPAIGTPVGGTLEILRPFGPDWFFEGVEAEAMAKGLLRRIPQVQADPQVRSRCREYVLERYAWDVVIPQVEKLMAVTAGRAK